MSDFDNAMKFLLRWEGGKSDDPRDRGGRTAYGVTQRTYDAFRRRKGRAQQDVWAITQEEVAECYQEGYWKPVTGGRPWPLNLVMFDSAVNCGVSRATGWIENAKKLVSVRDPKRMDKLAEKVLEYRQAHYDALGADPDFAWAYKGWMNRLTDLYKAAGIEQPTPQLYWPVPMGEGMDEFETNVGQYLDPQYYAECGSEHPGQDFNIRRRPGESVDKDRGKPYGATCRGWVIYVGEHKVWGWITVMSHVHPLVGKFCSMYAHSEKVLVKVGQYVQGGQQIGTIGKGGGNRMPAHLHFEIRNFTPDEGLPADFWPSTKYPNRKQAQDCIRRNYRDPVAVLKKYGAINPVFDAPV